MKDIPTIMTSQEILDKAFRRVQKVIVTDQTGIDKTRSEATGRLSALSHTISAVLNKYIRAFPSLDQMHPFERELIDISVGLDDLRHSLGAIDWARKTVETIQKKEFARIRNARTRSEISSALNSSYGRISSVLNKVSGELDFLNEARDKLQNMPGINPNEPVVVIAGCPNVGKSQIVARISSGKPEIASYPFTTKGVSIGHLHIGYDRIQVMDTPGLLDRELQKRNKIELQAIAALEHLADVLVYVFDPSETCGYSLETQNNLLLHIKKTFTGIPLIVVSNKCDLGVPGEGIQISARDDRGMEDLLDWIKKALGKRESAQIS
jgi:nucleolar GTP-binding protein